MKDIRISIRLKEDQHQKLKIYAAKNKTNIQKILIEFINKLLESEDKND